MWILNFEYGDWRVMSSSNNESGSQISCWYMRITRRKMSYLLEHGGIHEIPLIIKQPKESFRLR